MVGFEKILLAHFLVKRHGKINSNDNFSKMSKIWTGLTQADGTDEKQHGVITLKGSGRQPVGLLAIFCGPRAIRLCKYSALQSLSGPHANCI